MTFQYQITIRLTIIITPCSNTKNLVGVVAIETFTILFLLLFFLFFLVIFLLLISYPSNSDSAFGCIIYRYPEVVKVAHSLQFSDLYGRISAIYLKFFQS